MKKFKVTKGKAVTVLLGILAILVLTAEFCIFSKTQEDKCVVEASKVAEKPVIYFYPTQDDTTIKYTSQIADEYLCTYPEYKNGWIFKANKDGILTIEEREYNYLYWESESEVLRDNINLGDGWVLQSKEVVPFLEKKLEELNLTDREVNDFITYWLPRLIAKPFVYIKFANDEFHEYTSPTVVPKPDTYIPVFMVFKTYDEKPDWGIKEQIVKPIERKGFTVVEWGGMEL